MDDITQEITNLGAAERLSEMLYRPNSYMKRESANFVSHSVISAVFTPRIQRIHKERPIAALHNFVSQYEI